MATETANAEASIQDVSPFKGPYAKLLRFSFFNASTWLIGLGTPMVLLATELGANSFDVGLAYSFVFLLLPVQIVAVRRLLALRGSSHLSCLLGCSLFFPPIALSPSSTDTRLWRLS